MAEDQQPVYVGQMTGETQLDKLSQLFNNVWHDIFLLIDDFRRISYASHSEFRVDRHRTARIVDLKEHPSFDYLNEVLLIILLLQDELDILVKLSEADGELVKHFIGHLIEANDILSGTAWQGIRADEIDADDARSQETMEMIRGKLDQLKQNVTPMIESCPGRNRDFNRASGFTDIWIKYEAKKFWDRKTLTEMLRLYNISNS